MPYRLLMTPRSPFARRIRLAFLRNGIDFTDVNTDVFNPTEEFLRNNPLGLVPVLLDEGAPPIADSNTILEVLHERHGRIWPQDPELRLAVRISATLATGIMMATVQHFLETKRTTTPTTGPSAEWLADFTDTITRSLDQASKLLSTQKNHGFLLGSEFSQAGWDLAVALEYLDFRCPSLPWREKFPTLPAILAQAKRDPFFSQTAPVAN